MIRGGENEDPNRRRALSRRRLLASVAAGGVGTVAGCSGGGDGSDGSDSNSDGGGDADSTVQDLCGRIPGEFVGYDSGETNLIVDFDMPSVLEEIVGPVRLGFTHRGEINASDEYIGLEVAQTVAEDEVNESPSEYDIPQELETEFGGETVPFHTRSDDYSSERNYLSVLLVGDIPHTVGSTKLYFPVFVSVDLSQGESVPDDCRESGRTVARRVAESLRPNEETTIESHLQDNWDDPP